jgi:hypothetical protein
MLLILTALSALSSKKGDVDAPILPLAQFAAVA